MNDTLYELLRNITIGGADNCTHSEKRRSKSATEESIAFHFQIAKNEMKDVWPQAIMTESVLRTYLHLCSRKLTEAQNAKIRKLNEERRASRKDEFFNLVDQFISSQLLLLELLLIGACSIRHFEYPLSEIKYAPRTENVCSFRKGILAPALRRRTIFCSRYGRRKFCGTT